MLTRKQQFKEVLTLDDKILGLLFVGLMAALLIDVTQRWIAMMP